MSDPKGHHPNLPSHRTLQEATRAVPVFLELARGAPGVDLWDGVQAGAVLLDYGSSFGHIHNAGSTAGSMTEQECFAELELFSKSCDPQMEMKAFPWVLMIPIITHVLTKIIERMLKQ